MSKYTTEVRYICETAARLDESKGYNSLNDILNVAAPAVFDFYFPIFDESYRMPLEIKILKHFYTREISEETVGLWKLRLDAKMNEIMPYFNKLYRSELLSFNPLYDVDYTATRHGNESGNAQGTGERKTQDALVQNSTEQEQNTFKENDTRSNEDNNRVKESDNNSTNESNRESRSGTANNESTSTDNRNANNWDLYSDTPQGGVGGIAKASGSLSDDSYLTNARNVLNNESGNAHTDGTSSTEDTSEGSAERSFVGQRNREEDNTSSSIGERNGNSDTERARENAETRNGNEDTKTTNTFNNTNDYVEHVIGKRGGYTYSKMLEEFRKTLLNIDMMIIDALEPLFFSLW